MKETNCENVLMAMAAVFDGEKTEFSPEELNSHLAACQNCRKEIEEMQTTFDLLKSYERAEHEAVLWNAVENRISAETSSPISLKPFIFLGIFLVGYKLLEMIPDEDFGFLFRFVPLVSVIALFVFIKENPFKINAQLAPEK